MLPRQLQGDKGEIPLLPENAGKRSLNYLGTLGTLERVTTTIKIVEINCKKNKV